MNFTLEDIFAGKGFAGVDASPLQLAITRAAQGRPLQDVLDADALTAHFGATELPEARPRCVAIVAGVRSGKSFLAACALIWLALTADLAALKKHEVARGVIVSPRTDTSAATFSILRGIIEGSSILARFLEGEPTADTLVIRRPDGRRVELVVSPASSGGISVRNRWLVGLVLEELASFGTLVTGKVINAEEMFRAGMTRLVPGGQVWLISSPFGPQGLLWETYRKHFGRPGDTIVIHAPTRAMNPSFPQVTIDAIAEDDPDTARREYGAEWIDAITVFLAAFLIDRAQREAPERRPRARAWRVWCAQDPATRGNEFTLVGAHAEPIESEDDDEPAHRVVVDFATGWRGSQSDPLDPGVVFAEMGAILREYEVEQLVTDQWSIDALQSSAERHGIQLLEPRNVDLDMQDAYQRLRRLLAADRLELPPGETIRQDLISIRKRATASHVRIELPHTADGRHCDYAPSIAMAVALADRDGPAEHVPYQSIRLGRSSGRTFMSRRGSGSRR